MHGTASRSPLLRAPGRYQLALWAVLPQSCLCQPPNPSKVHGPWAVGLSIGAWAALTCARPGRPWRLRACHAPCGLPRAPGRALSSCGLSPLRYAPGVSSSLSFAPPAAPHAHRGRGSDRPPPPFRRHSAHRFAGAPCWLPVVGSRLHPVHRGLFPTLRSKGSRQALACATGVAPGPASFLALPLGAPTASVARAFAPHRYALRCVTISSLRGAPLRFWSQFRLRLHRSPPLNTGGLPPARLRRWARQRPAASYAGAPPPAPFGRPTGSAPA